ncbi:DUF2550 domain-containing protein [Rhodococcus sp. HNM0569]|uniref:DUF2550 domain-containing protein n=1 Tax=Rhodococcus sp. HNM0569 TaxID=2716340 RepID=UPI00146CE14E|nr:DUF2550 domain-containing protein [Rhodococcus sp. HNM0569]NLU84469.1 DUF2550 domain-containing protein [Rhodococcus sp. HNM0569]
MILLIILVVLLAAAVAAFLYRLRVLHRGGTAAIVRTLPAAPGAGWRHGIMCYGESALVFYKLSSLKPGPDTKFARRDIELGARRAPKGNEFDIMTEDIAILEVSDGVQNYEFALDGGALTAFLSWVEARPSGRSMRRKRF